MSEGILVVDDQRANLVAIEAALEGIAGRLVFAHSGEEALRFLLERDFAVVQLDVPTVLLVERIAGRAAEQGRADDNPESVRQRLQVYNDQTAPVVDFYAGRGTLARVDGVGELDDVEARIRAAIHG
jgi:adenylate kinase family enzyme